MAVPRLASPPASGEAWIAAWGKPCLARSGPTARRMVTGASVPRRQLSRVAGVPKLSAARTAAQRSTFPRRA